MVARLGGIPPLMKHLQSNGEAVYYTNIYPRPLFNEGIDPTVLQLNRYV